MQHDTAFEQEVAQARKHAMELRKIYNEAKIKLQDAELEAKRIVEKARLLRNRVVVYLSLLNKDVPKGYRLPHHRAKRGLPNLDRFRMPSNRSPFYFSR